ncbi:type-2 angiotensin II receptor [Genypterus blacodes]|uniref:type-2 angiotensin II receptor n=1 Tax=Genypterus blacodes TaxID=154954 RepID=UPI003F75987B
MSLPDDLTCCNTTQLPGSWNASQNSSQDRCPGWPSLPMTTIIPAFFSVICALGTVANGLAVSVLAHGSSSRRTVANMFMLNLCVSDLLFLLTLPLWAVYYSLGYHWPFGRLVCKICGSLLQLNLYASIFFITCMSIDRYLAIVHPFRSQSARYPKRAQLTCALVWVLACASTAPMLVFRDLHPIGPGVEACAISYPDGWFLPLTWMKIILAFLLPLLVISSCYCTIGRHLLANTGLRGMHKSCSPSVRAPESQDGSGKSERPPTPCVNPSCRGRPAEGRGMERVLWTVAAVVLAFFLCWFPFHCVTLLDVLKHHGWLEGCWVDWSVRTFLPLTLCLGFSHSAINPVLYCYIGNHFRGRLGGLCKDLCACLKTQSDLHSQKRWSFSTRLSSFSRKLSDLKDLANMETSVPN